MADITTSQVFTDGERGITAAKLNNIQGAAAIQPAFFSAKPVASSLASDDTMLVLKNTGAYAKTPFQTVIDSVSAAISSDAEIWSVRLRSFNAIGNPNFEIDQINVNAFFSNQPTGTKACDRWQLSKSAATGTVNTQASNSGSVLVPGTSFCISNTQQALQIGTTQATLAATDLVFLQQFIEGPRWRELSADATSVSLLVYSTVALKFSLSLRSASAAQSLCKLCTIPSANTWTLITLPNLPKPSSGTFSILPGIVGITLSICLAAGSTYTPPANDVWQNGNFVGAVGMDNWLSKPVNSNFYVAFVQHEPGPVCSTLMDKPFSQNLDECKRYYTKSYNYGVKPGTASSQAGEIMIPALASTQGYAGIPYKSTMAKTPTITAYDPVGGNPNGVYDLAASAARTVSGIVNAGDSGFGGVTLTTPNAANTTYLLQYGADTGW